MFPNNFDDGTLKSSCHLNEDVPPIEVAESPSDTESIHKSETLAVNPSPSYNKV